MAMRNFEINALSIVRTALRNRYPAGMHPRPLYLPRDTIDCAPTWPRDLENRENTPSRRHRRRSPWPSLGTPLTWPEGTYRSHQLYYFRASGLDALTLQRKPRPGKLQVFPHRSARPSYPGPAGQAPPEMEGSRRTSSSKNFRHSLFCTLRITHIERGPARK